MAKPVKRSKSIKRKNTGKDKRSLIIRIGIIALAAAVVILFIVNNFIGKKEKPEEYMFKKDGELTFYNAENQPVKKIDIEIADTEYYRQLGLMFRTEMEENQGMLFIFPQETIQSFWMRNTNIPLDILFVNSKREIVTIHKNTTPLSDRSYFSTEPSVYVVEVIAGFTDKFDINTGDKINWMDSRLRGPDQVP